MNTFSLKFSCDNKSICKTLSGLNRNFLSSLTSYVADCTKSSFQQKLQENGLDKYIKQINEPLTDSLGRSTYFEVRLGGLSFPVYQMGTPCYFSGVTAESQLAIVRDDNQVNGGIVGNNCALFISKFCNALGSHYERHCTNGFSKDQEEYHLKALKDCIKEYKEENASHCGRVTEYDLELLSLLPEDVRMQLFFKDQGIWGNDKNIMELYNARRSGLVFGDVFNYFDHGLGTPVTLIDRAFVTK